MRQDKAPKLIQDMEREVYLNRLVYAATESTEINYDKKSEGLDHSDGRDVYYVTVGQIKRTKIVIKNTKQDGTKVILMQTFDEIPSILILFW